MGTVHQVENKRPHGGRIHHTLGEGETRKRRGEGTNAESHRKMEGTQEQTQEF